MTHQNLLEPPETLLEVDPAAAELLAGADAAITAGRYPESALAWATGHASRTLRTDLHGAVAVLDGPTVVTERPG